MEFFDVMQDNLTRDYLSKRYKEVFNKNDTFVIEELMVKLNGRPIPEFDDIDSALSYINDPKNREIVSIFEIKGDGVGIGEFLFLCFIPNAKKLVRKTDCGDIRVNELDYEIKDGTQDIRFGSKDNIKSISWFNNNVYKINFCFSDFKPELHGVNDNYTLLHDQWFYMIGESGCVSRLVGVERIIVEIKSLITSELEDGIHYFLGYDRNIYINSSNGNSLLISKNTISYYKAFLYRAQFIFDNFKFKLKDWKKEVAYDAIKQYSGGLILLGADEKYHFITSNKSDMLELKSVNEGVRPNFAPLKV